MMQAPSARSRFSSLVTALMDDVLGRAQSPVPFDKAMALRISSPAKERQDQQKVWTDFDKKSLNPWKRQTVMTLGSRNGALSKWYTWSADKEVSITAISGLNKARELRAQRECVSLLVIDLDERGGIGHFFEELYQFRQDCADVIVILVSETFSDDDFDLNRIWLCDVSLRAASTFTAIDLSMTMSGINNAEWQRRCKTPRRSALPCPPRSARHARSV